MQMWLFCSVQIPFFSFSPPFITFSFSFFSRLLFPPFKKCKLGKRSPPPLNTPLLTPRSAACWPFRRWLEFTYASHLPLPQHHLCITLNPPAHLPHTQQCFWCTVTHIVAEKKTIFVWRNYADVSSWVQIQSPPHTPCNTFITEGFVWVQDLM